MCAGLTSFLVGFFTVFGAYIVGSMIAAAIEGFFPQRW